MGKNILWKTIPSYSTTNTSRCHYVHFVNSETFYFPKLALHLPELFSLYSQRSSSILSDQEELYIPLPQDMAAYDTTISVPLWKLQEIEK